MRAFNKYWPLLVSLFFYFLLWKIMYPVLGFNLDSDCVSYLTISERVAKGEYIKSINGLWSPLNCWLAALFIKQGHDSWTVAKYLNLFFGSVILLQSFFLFVKFKLNRFAQICFQFVLSGAMVYMVYFQMFGDVLQLIFVLTYLILLWCKDNKEISYWQIVLGGIIMGIGFYAKAYSFFFLVVHLALILFLWVKKRRLHLVKAVKMYLLGVFCSVLIMLPWTFCLHKKYNEWTLNGHAGKLNMSWYIESGKSFKEDITLLIPPTYNDSPSFWEDPYLSQHNLVSPFSSFKHFVKWMMRVVHTIFISVLCFQEISFLSLAIILIGVYYFFIRKKRESEILDFFSSQILVTICVLPMGYLMMHIETRYIWLNIVLLMILAGILFNYLKEKLNPIIYRIAVASCAFSFFLFPLIQFENLKYKNKDLFETANFLKEKNIKGRFTSNVSDAGRMWVLAYLTGSNFYTIEKSGYSLAQLQDEMKRYNVKYYFFESENNVPLISIPDMKEVAGYGNLKIFERAEH